MATSGYDFVDSVPEELLCKKCTLVARRLVIISCCGESFCQTCIADTSQPCPACGEDSFTTFDQPKSQKRISSLKVYCSMKEEGCAWSGTLDQLDTHLNPDLDNCQYVGARSLQEFPKNKLDLTSTTSAAAEVQFQEKLLEQDQKHKKEEERLKKSIEKQEKKLEEQQDKIEEQERKLGEQEKKLIEQVKTLEDQEQRLEKQEKTLAVQQQTVKKITESLDFKMISLEQSLDKLLSKSNYQDKRIYDCIRQLGLNRKFVMENYSIEKAKDTPGQWKSPFMYTHVYGYKFCVGVNANGHGEGRGFSISVDFWSMPGEFDDKLKWPARAELTLELINQQGGDNAKCRAVITWQPPEATSSYSMVDWFNRIFYGVTPAFISQSELPQFLLNDALHFKISSF